ncbi:MAG: RsmE family RNA methyltransferase [Candidatus Eremiobacteraeota bacterium]|nr:RsmE family RNA methyltransferase [Candidatus Eremiobacteraeota bacterium]
MPRFYVPPDRVSGGSLSLEGAEWKHARQVLRLRRGDRFTAIDGTSREYLAELHTVEVSRGTARILEVREVSREPSIRVTLYQALIKAPRLEYVVEKATEIGVAAIIPLITARSAPLQWGHARETRWNSIVRSASCQSGRTIFPGLSAPVSLGDALSRAAGGTMLFFSPDEGTGAAMRSMDSIPEGSDYHVFIGPEGGFSGTEWRAALERGALEITLGSRVLRAETAALVCCSLLIYRR